MSAFCTVFGCYIDGPHTHETRSDTNIPATPKPVDTGGVEGGGEPRLVKGEDCPAASLYAIHDDETGNQMWCGSQTIRDRQISEINAAIAATEKPADSMGGEKDELLEAAKELGYAAPDGSGSVTDEVETELSTAPTLHMAGKVYRVERSREIEAGETYLDTGCNIQTAKNRTPEGVWMHPLIDLAEPIGEQQTEPATNSVTPQGAQATDHPTPLGQTTTDPTEKPSDLDAPQPEKREGPYKEGKRIYRGENRGWIQIHDHREAVVANAAYRAGQLAQPEGDERLRLAAEYVIRDATVKGGDGGVGERSWVEVSDTALTKLVDALGSGEGQ